MSQETTPKMKVAEALMASMAIPGFFSPQIFEDKLLIDGGVVNNFPISGAAGTCNPESTIGFHCGGEETKSINKKDPPGKQNAIESHEKSEVSKNQKESPNFTSKSAWMYFEQLVSVLLKMLDRGQLNHREEVHTIFLPLNSIKGISALTWDVTYDQRKILLEKGIQCADSFIDQEPRCIFNSPMLNSIGTQTDD